MKKQVGRSAVFRRTTREKNPPLVVVGSVALDILHTPNGSAGPIVGGSAVHCANGASFFAETGIVGVVGDDYPMNELDFLQKRRVNLSGLEVRPGASFLWEGRYSEGFVSRETLRTELGVFADFRPRLPESYRKPRILFLGAIHPGLQDVVLKQVARPRLVAIDTFKLWIDVARTEFMRIVKRTDLLLVNDDEVRWLTGEHNLLKGTQALHKFGPQWIVVKKGEHGSFLSSPRGLYLTHAFPVEHIVDPTGAGDAYAGGMLGYLAAQPRLNDVELRKALYWASVVGSFYVEGFGPDGLKHVTRAELNARHRQLCKMAALP
ncbi:MAG: PfkB family carbohydrate kinase [bacterium]|nr:PfkB family carbohydrate kinase [bacterium]